MSRFWSSCLSQFEQELPPQQFNTWIRPLRLEGEEDLAQRLRLLAPNGFILKWVKERYLASIEALGKRVLFDAGQHHAEPRRTGRSVARIKRQVRQAALRATGKSVGRGPAMARKAAPVEKDRSATRKPG
jgi:chromosomal replication initiator protein